MKSILKYHGSKARMAHRIIPMMPPHMCYVEPYAGSAAVLLRKPPSDFEVYNDINLALHAFFQVLRDRREELERLLYYTPHHRHEHAVASEMLCNADKIRAVVGTESGRLEVARLVYVAANQSRHWPATASRAGWRYQHSQNRGKNVNEEWRDLSGLHACAERLRCVQIECDDAISVIRRYDTCDTLFYVDPPYVLSTRCPSWSGKTYEGEMTDEEHVVLLTALRQCAGMVMISGYRSELYDDLLHDWDRHDFHTITDRAFARTECLWVNPSARQQTLFTPSCALASSSDQ